MEALWRTRDDLQQRLRVTEVQVRSPTSTLSSNSTAEEAGIQSYGSGKSGSQ